MNTSHHPAPHPAVANTPVDPDLAEQAIPGHGIPSQDPNPAAQHTLTDGEARREANSALMGGGMMAGAAAGAAVGVAAGGPVGVFVGGTAGAIAGASGGAAVGRVVEPEALTETTAETKAEAAQPAGTERP